MSGDTKFTVFFFLSLLVFVLSIIFTKICFLVNDYIAEISLKDKKLDENEKKHTEELQALDVAHKKDIALQKSINERLSSLLKSKNPFKDTASMAADFETSIFEKEEKYLRYKPRPAERAADKVKEIRTLFNRNLSECKQILYKYEFLLSVFPELKEYVEDEKTLLSLSEYENIDDINDKRDRVKDWLSKDEYYRLTENQRNQLALDRYKNRRKTNWEIGIEYELYIGYLLREGKPPFNRIFHVIQFGELNGLNDLGRDIIAEKSNLDGTRDIYVIQCKRWAENRLVHENAICQLFGTTIEYKIKHRHYINCNFIPVFITTTELSNMAIEFARVLNVKVYKCPMGDYPMIKCNINGYDKIYHLPFDQQYHNTLIKDEGEFYAMTVKEATDKGFRRAMKHFI